MPRRSSNWDAHRARSTSPGRSSRRQRLGAAARRTASRQSSTQHTVTTKVKAAAVALLVAASGGVTLAVSEHAQTLTSHALDSIFGDDKGNTDGHLTVSSITPMDVNAGATVIYARPTPLTQKQIVHAMATSTGAGAVLPNSMAEKVVLTNTGSSTVYVTDISVHKSCTSPLTGTIVYAPPLGEGGAPTGIIGLGFDLDSPSPLAQNFDADTLKLSGRYFLSHDVPVVKGIPQTLVLFVRTRRYHCHYSYEMTLRGSGKQTTRKISDKGQPFEVTADLIGKRTPHPLASYRMAYVADDETAAGLGAQKTTSSSSPNTYVQVDPKTWKPPR